jgi:hypothetical protein
MGQEVVPDSTSAVSAEKIIPAAVAEEDEEWFPPPPEAGNAGANKLMTKMKENPFVPLGEYLYLPSTWHD